MTCNSKKGWYNMGFLNVLEVSKKQYYIFKSNKLKENIGASEIIRYVTEELVNIKCKQYKGKILNTGGGQSIFYFETMEDSENFAKDYSLKLLEDYPSMEFFIARIEYNPQKDLVIEKIDELHAKLEKKKAQRSQYSYILDFGITEKCNSTRLPAVYFQDEDDERTYYSEEANSKIKAFQKLSKNKEERKYALDIIDLGVSKNEKSYIAITHIDGNKMGQKIKKLNEEYKKRYTSDNIEKTNKEYLDELNKFSNDIKVAFNQAFQKVVNKIQQNMDYLKENLNIKDNIFPIRKVILSGDDVCYMTDARIALECASIFLKELEEHKIFGEKITACAGVAMVKEKYPFFKTYELSEELCRNAKSTIADNANESRIDWHIVQGEYNNNLDEVRNTAYKTHDGKQLSLRPLMVSEYSTVTNHYNNFKKDMAIIQSSRIPRSKIKGMLQEMKKGEKQVDTYIEINKLYSILGPHRIGAKTGFIDGQCVLFDAIETMDYYIPLCEEE